MRWLCRYDLFSLLRRPNDLHFQEVDLYVDFMHSNADLERFAYSITLEQVGVLNELTGEWQGSTMQLVKWLHEKAPCIKGKPF